MVPRWPLPRRAWLLLAACLALLACGQRGPLYLPETGAAPEAPAAVEAESDGDGEA